MNSYDEKDYTSEKFSIGVWKKIFKIVLEDKKYLALMITTILAVVILDIIYPLLNAYGIQTFFEKGDYTNVRWFIAAYILIAIGYGVFVTAFIRFTGIVETNVGYKIRKEAFNRLQELPFAYYDKTPAGWIMARLTSDSRRLAAIISWGLIDILWGSSLMIGIVITLFIIKWQLALIITALLPILFFVSIYFRKKILKSYRGVRKINSRITGAYNEGILGSKTTKTLVLEDIKNEEFEDLAANMRKESIRAIVFSSIFFPILLIIGYVGVMVTLRMGGSMVLIGAIDVAILYLFINYTTQFFEPIMQVARILAELQQAQAYAERIIGLIETNPEIYDTEEVIATYGDMNHPKLENYETLHGKIEFQDVSFWYKENEVILDNFNLVIPEGTSVALVGKTGSGKSTIVNLICRFYEPKSGKILIDGKDYKARSLHWLHSNLGYVLQSPHLFNGTIAENIAYGTDTATEEEIIAAAKAVSAHEFIIQQDEGYQTNVGEGGAKLSLGQKQLISFARAVIADPKILILDEATSSIDTKTEQIIQSVTKDLLKGRTSFIIAHRLSTIINADMILVIDEGKILEQGSHHELLLKKGEYFNLYKNQFMKERIEQSKY